MSSEQPPLITEPSPDVVALPSRITHHASRITRLHRHRLTLAAGLIVLALIIVAAGAPWIAPYHYAEQHLEQAKLPPGPKFWLGTDAVGRDIFSRLIYGAQVSLRVALVVEAIELLIGVTLGMLA